MSFISKNIQLILLFVILFSYFIFLMHHLITLIFLFFYNFLAPTWSHVAILTFPFYIRLFYFRKRDENNLSLELVWIGQ